MHDVSPACRREYSSALSRPPSAPVAPKLDMTAGQADSCSKRVGDIGVLGPHPCSAPT